MMKNKHSVKVLAKHRLETLERIFRVIRHRGGHISQMQMTQQDDMLHLYIELLTQRPIQTIFSQIEKLIDVQHIEMVEPQD